MTAGMARQVVVVGAGVAVLGLTSFGYLAVAGRALGPAAVVPLTTLWVLVNAVGPALFFPLEQEVGRAVAVRTAVGVGARPVLLRAGAIAAGLLGVLVVASAAAGAPLSRTLFDGHVVVLVSFVVGSVGLCAQHLVRGALAGTGAFGRYGLQLGLDGTLRLAGALALAAAASTEVGWYAVLLGVAPVLAVLLTVPRPGRLLTDGPPASWSDVGGPLALLVAGTICAQFVVNAAPIAANLLARDDQQADVGIFISAFVLVRVPLFAFAAVQASLLPGLAQLAALDARVRFRRRLRLILLLIAGLGAGGVVVIAAVGPWLVRLAFGAQFLATRAELLPLAVATAAYMLALVLSQSLISLRCYRASLVGWAGASATFLVALLIPADLEVRVGSAFLAAAVVGALAMGVAMAMRLRRPLADVGSPGPAPDPGAAPWPRPTRP